MSEAIQKIESILNSKYSTEGFVELVSEIFDSLRIIAPYNFHKEYSNFSSHIEGYSHIGEYKDPNGKSISVFSVRLKTASFVENSRSTQRSFARKLIDAGSSDAAIIAFYTEGEDKWRLSFVRLDYEMRFESGKFKATENLTPARRYSFLVGQDEPCHTAISRFRKFILDKNYNPTLDEIEDAFSIEKVTKEFFELYCEKYHQLREALEKNEDFVEEAKLHNYTSAQFAKKLMGQIVFLYFLQKKGWLGVSAWPRVLSAAEYKKAFYAHGAKSRELIPQLYFKVDDNTYRISGAALNQLSDEDETFLSTCVKGEPWGTGPRNFMRRLFELAIKRGENFFDSFLEPLFYDALNVNRGEQGYDPALHCRIPFLSGGLFEPMDGYDWKHNNFAIPNELFSNKKDAQDWYADGILDIFDRYNFTMSEDEPLEREVAIDPEMLGKVFENLLDVNDRKSKGAFYTPREIVHYMCQESLINYLTNTLKVKESSIRDFILYGDFMKDEDASILIRAAKGESYDLWVSEELYLLGDDGSIQVDRMLEFDEALKNVRVADPAVGSGAFPLGMLNEIVRARQNITTYLDITQKLVDPKGASREIRYRRINERSARQLKFDTIRNCIYAVDIEPSAVDIARLRLWLALVIDDEIDPNAITALDGHRNPLPLPNLECNILCGNSLIDQFEGIKLINESELLGNTTLYTSISLYQSAFSASLQRLIEKQKELFVCDRTDKKELLLREIDDLRDSVILSQLEGASFGTISKYEETRTMASKPFILWHLDFARVFIEKGGFDIVIGNPPYIQLQKTINEDTKEKLGDQYASLGFETFTKTGDIYCLFYEKGFHLLHDNGMLAFITSNKWMRAGYGERLRNFFASKANPIILIDFSNQRVFESATVDVNILILSRELNKGQTKACIAPADSISNLSVFVQQNAVTSCFQENENWAIMSKIESGIKQKIETKGIPLKEWGISINRGILTGYNEAFIISTAKKAQLVAEDPKSADIIRPILRGRDIRRYGYDWGGLWIIATFPSKRYDINEFPAVKRHLLSYGIERLEQTGKKHIVNGITVSSRKKTTNQWFETQDAISYWDDFSKPKIDFAENMRVHKSEGADRFPRFSYIESEYFHDKTSFIVTGTDLLYILAVINSSVMNYFIHKNVAVLDTGGFLMQKIYIEMMPIPHADERTHNSLVSLSKQVIELRKNHMDSSSEEDEIDDLVFKLYGFTDEEISTIKLELS